MSTQINTPKYAHLTAVITDGNAFMIMGAVQKVLRNAGVSKEVIDEYFNESTSGDYSHLLSVAASYVNLEWQ